MNKNEAKKIISVFDKAGVELVKASDSFNLIDVTLGKFLKGDYPETLRLLYDFKDKVNQIEKLLGDAENVYRETDRILMDLESGSISEWIEEESEEVFGEANVSAVRKAVKKEFPGLKFNIKNAGFSDLARGSKHFLTIPGKVDRETYGRVREIVKETDPDVLMTDRIFFDDED